MSDHIEVPEDEIDMRWTDAEGNEHRMFDERAALAALLLAEKVFLNARHWCETDKEHIAVCVNCNDVFAWGCADAEDLPYAEIENVWRMWRKDPAWGTDVWCIQRRKEMPQKPVEKAIREAGIWDLDAMGLEPNVTDDYVKAVLAKAVRDGQFESLKS